MDAQLELLNDPLRFAGREENGLRRLLGTFPCPYLEGQAHPTPSKDGRRLARFRRHIEGGVRYQVRRGGKIYFLTLAMRYKRELKEGRLRYSVQRFLQSLRRKGLAIEYLRVIEPTQAGVQNHAHLVLAVHGGELPPEHDLKDAWAHATYGSSFEVKLVPASSLDVGWLSRYLSKALGSYLSKSFPDAEGGGLDRRCRIATTRTYVSTSRDWLPAGAEKEWTRLFFENAYVWMCSRGFLHTEIGQTNVKWLEWVDRQAWGREGQGREGDLLDA